MSDSDSEWLEISSNQGSDHDSLSSRDSDHDDDLASMPPSRRSSMSVGSSVDAEIDAWEGFADDNPEQLGAPDPVVATFATAGLAGHRRMLDSEGHISEEQLVTAALEQSLVGTLSSSHSSSLGVSSTVHNSLRDLRLSFPDPITSSRDELNRSYEAVSSTDCITDDDPDLPMTTAFPGEHAPLDEKLPAKDESSGDPTGDTSMRTLCGSDLLPVHRKVGHQIDFDVVLYGSTVQSREFAQWLLSTFATGGALLSLTGQSDPRRHFCEGTATLQDGNANAPSSQSSDRPSLAIVSLPISASQLPEHTVYLPVVFHDADNFLSLAYGSWSLLHIPAVRTLHLIQDSRSKGCKSHIVVDDPELRAQVDPKFVYRELGHLLEPRRRLSRMLEQLRPAHAVTFVALLSLIMSFAVNTILRSPAVAPTLVVVPAYATPSTFWDMLGTTPNSSVAPLTTTSCAGNLAVMPSTLKELALAVFSPATTTPYLQAGAISAAPSPSGACGSGTTGSPVGECKLMTWSERTKSTKDVILRPPTSLSNAPTAKAPPTHTPSLGGSGGASRMTALPIHESAHATSLSLKLPGLLSLSEVADVTMKALEEIVPRDVKDLVMALDNLMQAIGRQTTRILADSKSRARMLRARLQYRNERAKGKARDLRQRGEQIVSLASERLKARAVIAKTRANALKNSLIETSVWRSYAQAHGQWSEQLEKKSRRPRDGKRERKVGLFAKLKRRRENRKQRISV
ncbi:hypothetical protein B0H15DRAFT_808865 [Mycena belliarum]|uniref:Uncharacterized protein n=1 Tax=Mycena belliarum TaxID=1033014 RepID=A0AAD6UIP7_9AGAR|nr:hypothetical protein B0H15DRAFT_808865 [Mycena belliae]